MSIDVKSFNRWVAVPVPCVVVTTMTRAGMVRSINAHCAPSVSDFDDLRIMRALYFLKQVIRLAQNRGDLIEDALLQLPPEADFDVERSILTVVAQLQGSVLSAFTQTRKGAA